MSLSNSIRIPLVLPNVDIFTFGESNIFGYDSLNDCLIVLSLTELNNLNNQSIDRLHLSSSPTNSIRKLILNQDETILALISDKTAYLVYLPELNNLLSKGSRLCPLNIIPPSIPNSILINNSLIDLIWLSSNHLIIVNSIPSSSECHLYIVRPSKRDGIEYLQTFSVGLSSSKVKRGNSGTPNKNFSPDQLSDIVKLDLAKRKEEDLILILLFAIKANGDIFVMEIEQNQLTNNEGKIDCSFVGPIRILPSRSDNYGGDHSHSDILCLSCSEFPLFIFTNDKCKLSECIVLNPCLNEYYLYAIDSIHLSTNENNQIIKSMINDKLNSNIYYVCDLLNVYSIEILWIKQIQQKDKQIQKTNIQHLIKSNYFIQQIGLIQTNNKGQWLTIITNTFNNQQKELILIRPHCSSLSTSIQFHPFIQSIKTNSSLQFLDNIPTILHRDQSLPHLTLSSTSSSSTNISNSDFQTNLIQFIKIFSQEYIEKQEKVRTQLENKQRYLYDFQQTQFIANQELNNRLHQIQQTIQTLNQRFEQEYSRRKILSSNVDDILSVIEKHTPVASDAEILMHKQLERYQIQINSLQDKIYLLKQFISTQRNLNQNQQEIEQTSMENIQIFLQYFRDQIHKMKQKLETDNRNN